MTVFKTIRNLLLTCAMVSSQNVSAQERIEEQLGWTLSAQAYTFKLYTLAEALEKMHNAGLRSVEIYNSQIIGGGMDGAVDFKMDSTKGVELLNLLRSKGVKGVAVGVLKANTAEEWHQIFEFASAMGMKWINTEPIEEYLPLIGELATKYKITVGIHNHPKPSTYWEPKAVLEAIKKANSPYVGACADIGHWVRSGLDPVDCIRQYDGHLVTMHFKDLKEKSATTHDVHWGQGVCNVPAIIDELKRQGFSGNISVEYEYNWENNASDVAECVRYFREYLRSR